MLNDLEKARSPWPLHGRIFTPIDGEAQSIFWGEKPIQSAVESMAQQVTALLAGE